MFGGPRLSTVFASRWKALWWAAMVLVTAFCSVPKKGEDDLDPIAIATKVIGTPQPQATQAPHHVNPWAKGPPPNSAG